MYKNKITKIRVRQYFSIIVMATLVTDLVILLDVPFLRQILGFIFFVTFPGFLILHVLKLYNIDFMKKLVLSIGLSIIFLMFGGLLVNRFYYIISRPLSLNHLLILFNILLITLIFIAYKRNKDDFNIKRIFNFDFDQNGKLIFPLVFPILFPFMAIYGTHLMNIRGDNIILMMMLFLIPIYVVTVVILRNKIHSITYPIAISMIGIGLLLMRGLTSNYIIGTDIHEEYYVFRLTSANAYWDILNYYNVLNTLLSVTILPTIFNSLSDMDMYVFKLYYPLIFSVVPICIYIISKRYVDELYAFFASFFFMSQYPLYSMVDHARQAIALMYFALAIMIYIDDRINNIYKNGMILAFIFAVIVSHYTTAYVFFALIFSVWLFARFKIITSNKVHITMIFFFLVAMFFWYGQLTNIAFNDILEFGQKTFINLYRFSAEESREGGALMMFGKGIDRLPDIINVIVHDISFSFIIIGTFNIVRKHININFDIEYIIMIITSLVLCLFAITIPYVSYGYGVERLYFQMLIILSLVFVIGGVSVSRYILPKLSIPIILVVLIAQFFSGSYVIYQVFGVLQSPDLNKNGELGSKYYIYDQEIVSAKWLNDFNLNDTFIYTDQGGVPRLKLGYAVNIQPGIRSYFFKNNQTINDGYIYLRYENVIDKKIWPGLTEKDKNLKDYDQLFVGKYKIYTNGYSEIYN